MFLHPKPKRIRLSLTEKLWLIRHNAENKNISQGKLALDFSSGFEIDLQYLLVKKLHTVKFERKTKSSTEYDELFSVLINKGKKKKLM